MRLSIDVKQLHDRFLQDYDYTFWVQRVAALQLLLSGDELLKRVSRSAGRLLENPHMSLTEESIRNRVKLDIHFTSYHSSEALFALIFGFVLEPELPWYWLTTYRFSQFNSMVSDLADRGLSMFNPDEMLVAKTLFFNIADEGQQSAVERSARFAISYIRALARAFRDRQDYNSYKHGLRTLRAKGTSGSISTIAGGELLRWDETATTYLEVGEPVETSDGVFRGVSLVAKALDYERSIRIVVTNTHLMHNLIEIKKANFAGRKQANLMLFDEKSNVSEVLKPAKMGFALDKLTVVPLVSYRPKEQTGGP